jgi:signal peptidase
VSDAALPLAATHERRARTWRVVIRALGIAVTLGLAVVWFVVLRPVALAGPTDYVIVSGHSMEPTLRTGDVAVAMRREHYVIGDVVVYRVPAGEPAAGDRVIHRIVGGSARTGFVMKGDNKQGIDPWRPRPSDVVGKVVLTVPHVGVGLVAIRSTLGIAIVAGLTTLVVALGAASRERRLPG